MRQMIWIVDDEVDLAESFADSLVEHFDTKTFNSGESALKNFETQPHNADLLMLDIKMPGMDGVTLLEKIRAMGSRIPAIIVSGYAEKEHLARATGLNVSGYLEKPCDMNQLRDLVKRVLQEYIITKIKDHLVMTLADKSEREGELLKYYLERYTHAENLLYKAKIPLHTGREEVTQFLDAIKNENYLDKQIDLLNEQLINLSKKKLLK